MKSLQKISSICALVGTLSGCYMLFEPEQGPPPVEYPSMQLSDREKTERAANMLRKNANMGLEMSGHVIDLTLIASDTQRELHLNDGCKHFEFSLIDFCADAHAELVQYSVPDAPFVFRMNCDRDFLLGVDANQYYHTVISACIEKCETGGINERTVAAYNTAREKLEAHFSNLPARDE